jgi:phospholipid/cholesterol/gamma-HCH transport system permease protein
VAAARRGGVLTGLTEVGQLTRFSAEALKQTPGSARYFGEILRQAASLVRGSTPMIALMAAFIGFSATNFGYYFLRAAGAADFTGIVPGIGGIRLGIPIIFGYAFAAKVGCGLTSEIGAMRISEELDALESEAINPVRYIVGTRIAACLIFVPIACAVCMVTFLFGAWVNAIPVLSALPPDAFFRSNWQMQSVPTLLFGFVLMVIVAIVIVLVSSYYGYTASGGPAGVGRAVARNLLVNLVLIHIITGVAVLGVYGTDLKLPIGG